MAKSTEKTAVEGGFVARHAKTGDFVSVTTTSGTTKKNPKTARTVKEVSGKRSAALKRLADR